MRTAAEIIADKGVIGVDTALTVLLQLLHSVRDLHTAGSIHGRISPQTVRMDDTSTAVLDPAERFLVIGGIGHSDAAPLPPSLDGAGLPELPSQIQEARRVLIEAGVLLEPQRIDLYQLGAMLCFLVTVHGYFGGIEQRTQCQNAHF